MKNQLRTAVSKAFSIVFFCGLGWAQHPTVHVEPLVAGELVHFQSTLLGEDRPLTVQVPEGLPGDGFDVLIVLDAENHGYHVSGIVDFLAHEYVSRMPKTIVVGVPNTHRLRDTTPTATERWTEGGGVRSFVRFLAEEVQPWVDRTYPTSGKYTLVGHSGSGLAAMYALIETPGAYTNIIAVDPSLDWDDDVFFKDAAASWPGDKLNGTQLILSSYKEKPWISDLKRFLKKKGPKGLNWSIHKHKGETHASMVHQAVYDALLELHPEQS